MKLIPFFLNIKTCHFSKVCFCSKQKCYNNECPSIWNTNRHTNTLEWNKTMICYSFTMNCYSIKWENSSNFDNHMPLTWICCLFCCSCHLAAQCTVLKLFKSKCVWCKMREIMFLFSLLFDNKNQKNCIDLNQSKTYEWRWFGI